MIKSSLAMGVAWPDPTIKPKRRPKEAYPRQPSQRVTQSDLIVEWLKGKSWSSAYDVALALTIPVSQTSKILKKLEAYGEVEFEWQDSKVIYRKCRFYRLKEVKECATAEPKLKSS